MLNFVCLGHAIDQHGQLLTKIAQRFGDGFHHEPHLTGAGLHGIFIGQISHHADQRRLDNNDDQPDERQQYDPDTS